MSGCWPPHSGVAQASQPFFLRLILPSRLRYRFGFACSGLRPLHRSTMPSADSCPPLLQVGRSPRVRRVTFTPCPPCLRPSAPDDFGLRIPTHPRPQTIASYTVRVPRAGALPAAAFRPHLAVDALAVRLGVPVIKASRGLAPPSHFPAHFRLPVDSATMALRAMPGARRVTPGSYPPRVPTDPYVRTLAHTVPQIMVSRHGDRPSGSREGRAKETEPAAARSGPTV